MKNTITLNVQYFCVTWNSLSVANDFHQTFGRPFRDLFLRRSTDLWCRWTPNYFWHLQPGKLIPNVTLWSTINERWWWGSLTSRKTFPESKIWILLHWCKGSRPFSLIKEEKVVAKLIFKAFVQKTWLSSWPMIVEQLESRLLAKAEVYSSNPVAAKWKLDWLLQIETMLSVFYVWTNYSRMGQTQFTEF